MGMTKHRMATGNGNELCGEEGSRDILCFSNRTKQISVLSNIVVLLW
jgi:hypothetical protein